MTDEERRVVLALARAAVEASQALGDEVEGTAAEVQKTLARVRVRSERLARRAALRRGGSQ